MIDDYLRQSEFQRWAAVVDRKLEDQNKVMMAHGEALAVLMERKTLGDADRNDRRKLTIGIVTACVSSLLAMAAEAWHLMSGVSK